MQHVETFCANIPTAIRDVRVEKFQDNLHELPFGCGVVISMRKLEHNFPINI